MAYLMVKYQEPTTYALLDLSADELRFIVRGLGEMHDLYERISEHGGERDADTQIVATLLEAIERRYSDDDV